MRIILLKNIKIIMYLKNEVSRLVFYKTKTPYEK